jgi:hypothetical protein
MPAIEALLAEVDKQTSALRFAREHDLSTDTIVPALHAAMAALKAALLAAANEAP